MRIMKGINFHNVDCMEFMKGIPDKAYELAIVDPPYGINATKMQMSQNLNRSDRRGKEKSQQSTAVKLRKGRLSQGSGHMKNSALVNMSTEWDSQKPSPEYFEQLFRVSKNQIIWGGNYFDLPPTRCIICWDKMQPWENFSQFEMAWTSFDKPAAMFRMSNTGGANDHNKIHPTQKPAELYRWLLSKFGNGGGVYFGYARRIDVNRYRLLRSWL